MKTRPDLVAFSCTTDYYQTQLSWAKALKEIRPDVLTIFGGVHVTATPHQVLERNEVDAIAIGEAEISFREFIEKGTKKGGFSMPEEPVKGIVFKKNGSLIGEFGEGPLADLNELPFPEKKSWRTVMPRAYLKEYRIMATRGCPYHCSYCFNSGYLKLRGRNILRHRSVDNVIAELVWAKNRVFFFSSHIR